MDHKSVNTAATGIAGTNPSESVSGLYSVIEESARLLEVPCSPDKVLPILTVYGEALADAVVAFRVATGERHAGELDCRFSIPLDVDPYGLAVSNGFIADGDHPAGTLLSDIAAGCPLDCYGIDFGVVGGLKKIWAVLRRGHLQEVSRLAALPSMPRGLGESVDFFARHRLGDKAGLLGIDYRSRTVNVYFGEQPAQCFEPETVRSMLDELGQGEPSEQMLTLAKRAFGIYVTLNWDSPRLERICFAVATADPAELPVPLDPRIERFVSYVRSSDSDQRFVYAVASSPQGEYYKLQSYYRWQPRVLDMMQLSDGAIKDPV
ncbi:aromatic prenyltransferase Orf2 [Actinomadura pelletieri DSM 43383]|uniref:Aromatic prenyltransferase Orf2 n=1 Tax=Actinomadura pelletieri DSM 43383 TaxID=1120940 RepID=A0A495QT25_9ACTN|nr:aromatic prenyltransferase [Actinomadura pelletieri]RKS76652.1 aromatic prenyltransferase Orf2 [Actinomadura pelletieri DSM 43383]